jgi:hypothetical protein
VHCIVAQHRFDVGELADGLSLGLLLGGNLLFLLFGRKFGVAFHFGTLGGFVELHGKGLACAMQFSPDRIRGLFGQCADLFVAQLFVGDQQ